MKQLEIVSGVAEPKSGGASLLCANHEGSAGLPVDHFQGSLIGREHAAHRGPVYIQKVLIISRSSHEPGQVRPHAKATRSVRKAAEIDKDPGPRSLVRTPG